MSKFDKSQKSLHSFFASFKSDGTEIKLKRFFYLRWTDKFSPDFEATWYDERPQDVNFIHEVKWANVRKSHTFYLCGYFPDIEEKKFFIPHEAKYKNIHLIKSHLQKTIRKQDDILAIPTAIHMLKLEAMDLFRRLPIIMLEDTKLHKSFSTLIWLLVAISSTQFKMKKYMYEYILGIIYVLTKISRKDVINYVSEQNRPKTIDLLQLYNDLNDTECSLLYSMQLRIAYGGMQGDMEMFEQYANVWYNRFKTNSNDKVDNMVVQPISFFSVQSLELDNWDLSAIDFHCQTNFIDLIKKKFPDLEENEIKNLIWYNSSSINTRIPHQIYNPEQWNQIKGHVAKTQKYLLDKSY